MTLSDDTWHRHRPAVFGVAYRLLGTVSDAEDVVQDTWLRARAADLSEVRDLRAWLVTVAARRSYDVLTSARARREEYVGPWLPEPLLTGPDAAEPVLVDDTIGTAMLLVMEELSPDERLAVVLNGVFDVPYGQIGEMIGRSEPAVRQLASRARRRMDKAREPKPAPPGERERVLRDFRAAYEDGDLARLVALLHPDVVYTTDGGGKARAARRLIVGAERVAYVMVKVRSRFGPVVLTPTEINGTLGHLGFRDGRLLAADALEVAGGRVVRIHRQLNPEKLSHLPR